MSNIPDITVIIATYNRGEILRQTLESMTHLNRSGLTVDFVVVDNNSSDHTKEVIKSFTDKLPIRYLFESHPGKNCALNKALNEVPLGKLVVFTDDDVNPRKDWLKSVVSASQRWPQYSVFGGKQFLIFPDGRTPKWSASKTTATVILGLHDYGDTERPYPPNDWPFGANLWVRREVFADGRRFDETFGPRPTNRIMGSETSFLKGLTGDGYGSIYVPSAEVGHRIQPEQLLIFNILKRYYRHGRSIARMRPLCRVALFDKHPNFWHIVRIGSIIRLSFRLTLSLIPLIFQRPHRAVDAVRWIGYNVESMKIARETQLS